MPDGPPCYSFVRAFDTVTSKFDAQEDSLEPELLCEPCSEDSEDDPMCLQCDESSEAGCSADSVANGAVDRPSSSKTQESFVIQAGRSCFSVPVCSVCKEWPAPQVDWDFCYN